MARFVAELGHRFAFVLPPVNHCGVEDRSAAVHIEQAAKFVFGERSPLASGVNVFVGLGDFAERIGQQAAGLDAPVTKGNGGGSIDVTGSRPHACLTLQHKPSLQRFAGKIGKPSESTIGLDPLQIAFDVGAMDGRSPFGLQLRQVSVDLRRERDSLVVDGGGFVGRENLTPYLFGAPFQVGQQRMGGGFVAAAGRHFLDQSRAVAEFCSERPGRNQNAVGPVLPHGERRRSGLSLRVLPLRQPLPFADDDFGVGR
ncbi:MAG TPA: hypothetical protein VGJ26_21800 [Pirellulales bacterium]